MNDASNTYNVVRWVNPAAKDMAWDLNLRLGVIIKWLNENVGSRWKDWDHCREYGYVEIVDDELALLFKLKFGC